MRSRAGLVGGLVLAGAGVSAAGDLPEGATILIVPRVAILPPPTLLVDLTAAEARGEARTVATERQKRGPEEVHQEISLTVKPEQEVRWLKPWQIHGTTT